MGECVSGLPNAPLAAFMRLACMANFQDLSDPDGCCRAARRGRLGMPGRPTMMSHRLDASTQPSPLMVPPPRPFTHRTGQRHARTPGVPRDKQHLARKMTVVAGGTCSECARARVCVCVCVHWVPTSHTRMGAHGSPPPSTLESNPHTETRRQGGAAGGRASAARRQRLVHRAREPRVARLHQPAHAHHRGAALLQHAGAEADAGCMRVL